MKKIKLILLVLIPIVIVVSIYFYNDYNLEVNVNERGFESLLGYWLEQIEDIRGTSFEGYYDTLPFFYMTNFRWSSVYIFQPGTTKSEIEAIIGFEDRNIPEVIREGYTQMLFVQDRHIYHWNVAANIHGRKPYRFYVEGFHDEPYVRLDWFPKCRIEIEPDGTIKIILFDYTD